MGKEVELMFTITVGMPIWGLGQHESLITVLFHTLVYHRNWRGTWTIKGSDWAS